MRLLKNQSRGKAFESFTISESENISDEVTLVSPDIAVCDECLEDMAHQPRRLHYPLVNCCHCGPRFTIIKNLPYDRKSTTMQQFEMCENCRAEYENPFDRRFHAQPVSCNECGPVYTLYTKNKIITDIKEILSFLSVKLISDGIFAFKGTGGFHLACDAINEEAVKRLRQLKHRDTKPFAVMFKNISILKKYVKVSEAEEDELLSFRKPIVILNEINALAPSVTHGLGTIGAMLPYMPFHYLLFENIPCDVLVMTSGNISDEPIIIENKLAIETFANNTDGILTYNRDIYNRTDDSVVFVTNENVNIVRRSRGYVPAPINLPVNVDGIFAAGAEMTGTFCIGKNNQAIISQYFGDLQNYENFNFYVESFHRFKDLFRFKENLIAADMHPDYVTTRFAQEMGIQLINVQHHHAHIASVMAEHGLDEPVIGIAFDGTGYGPDGNIWGSEFLISTASGFGRVAHFEYIPLPGGDKAVLEPWRSAIAYLNKMYGENFVNLNIPFVRNIDKQKTALLLEGINKSINMPFSCSAGRLFDAVAAITGICGRPTFHAEAPMRLEAAIDKSVKSNYPFNYNKSIISFDEMWHEIVADLENNQPAGMIAAKFHNTIVEVIVKVCIILREINGIEKVALSGGTFQNRFILESVENILKQSLFKVYTNRLVPANDGGMALGQIYIAAKKLTNLN